MMYPAPLLAEQPAAAPRTRRPRRRRAMSS